MTRKQIQKLISAGVFSAALMSGLAYAQTGSTNPTGTGTSAPMKKKAKKSKMKKTAKHACAGHNECKGQGGCKTGDAGCKAKNSCKGKGGCATDGSKKM